MNLALSLATGFLLVLLFPRFDLVWLAPIALTPLLIACLREASWKRRFLIGWASGFAFWFFICNWIQFVLEFHGSMGRWGGWGTFTLFAILKGLHTALFAALAGRLLRRPFAIVSTAALWTAIEYAHGSLGLAWIGLGFAWLDLGNVGIHWPLVMRLAPMTGVYGISFLFAMSACAVALGVRKWWPSSALVRSVNIPTPSAMTFAPLLTWPLLALLPALPSPQAGTEPVNVVQTNIDTEAQWTKQSLADLEANLAGLSQQNKAPLVVWPEAPAPFYENRPEFHTYISTVAAASHASLLFSGIAFNDHGDPLNSAFLLNSEGQWIDRYDKIQLVPFGEYIPPAFSWVNRITGEAGDFRPGTRVAIMQVDGHKLGAFICYESAFPALVRQFAAGGADLLVNLSNDGYFGGSAAREQHLSLVRMRAAENQRWILRATNDGLTAMIDPAGRVTDSIAPYQRTARLMRFGYVTATTFYTRYGDWFSWTCWILALSSALLHRSPATRQN